MTQEWIVIGAIRSVNPAKRELRLDVDFEHAHEFEHLSWIRIRSGAEIARYRVSSVVPAAAGLVVVTMSPGVTRDTVSRLKGGDAVLTAEELHPRPEDHDEDAEADWTGMTVEDMQGNVLGILVEMYENRMNGAIRVEKTQGGFIMLPLIDQVVAAVDPDRGVLTVGDIEPYAVHEPAESDA